MADKIRWGIIGPGRIAAKMAGALNFLPDAQIAAVASRDAGRARAFADEHKAARSYGSYEELARDPDVDIVYVATPHPYHKENSLVCLENGKAVLCEKPVTINARQLEEVVAKAREKKLFFMEAMWTRFLPAMQHVKRLIAEGAIGDVRMLHADFGFRAEFDPASRIFDPKLGGGGLLDVGVYTVSLAQWLLGEPHEVKAVATLGRSGVDDQNAAVVKYAEGRIALLSSAVTTNTPYLAFIVGTEGKISIPYFWTATKFTVSKGDAEESYDDPQDCNGFEYEAAEAMRCLREGKLESDELTLDDSMSVMKMMDEMRAQWGLRYPGE